MTAALVAGSLLTGVPSTGAQAAEHGADSASPPRSARLPGVDLDTVTIPELQARMAKGALTSEALTRAYLRRIEKVDPKIHAVLRTSPTALREAAASDARHRQGKSLGPLDGIPVLL